MEIRVSRKPLIAVLIAAPLLAASGIAIWQSGWYGKIAALFSPTPAAAQSVASPDAQAVTDAVTTIYTLDYSLPAEQWESSVCAQMTPEGCHVFELLYAPAIRQVVEGDQVQTGCSVQVVKLVTDQGESRVWLLMVTLENPWQGLETPTQQVYAEVSRDPVSGKWLLERVLFEEEAAARYSTPTP